MKDDRTPTKQGVNASMFNTDPEYWDCMCDEHYVHHRGKGNFCLKCNTHAKTMPNSFIYDVKNQYNPDRDTTITKNE